MNCPKCGKNMDFEEAKNFFGTWYCDCGFDADGSHIPCGAEDGEINDYNDTIEQTESVNGSPVKNDEEEKAIKLLTDKGRIKDGKIVV